MAGGELMEIDTTGDKRLYSHVFEPPMVRHEPLDSFIEVIALWQKEKRTGRLALEIEFAQGGIRDHFISTRRKGGD
jgi:hypothetical protein